MSEILAGGIRFAVPGLRGWVFRRFPIDVMPPDGTIAFVKARGWQPEARFVDGEWRNQRGLPINPFPTHWAIMEVEPFGDA